MNDCAICRVQRLGGHWAWHRYCQCELNPVGFLDFIDRLPQTPEVEKIRQCLVALTGMDIEGARAALGDQE